MSIQERTHYERLSNGADLYLLRTHVRDVVSCMMAFPGGTNATYDRQSLAGLLETILPAGTRTRKRHTVRETFERLGASVSISESATCLVVSLTCRPVVLKEASTLLVEVLTQPRVQAKEFTEAVAQLDTELEHAVDDTHTQAMMTLLRALYPKGHPHWTPVPRDMRHELKTVSLAEVLDFHHHTLSSVGAVVCVVGDIHEKDISTYFRTLLAQLPDKQTTSMSHVHIGNILSPNKKDHVVSMRDKMNIDTFLAVPLTLTRDHSAYHALSLGVSILGASGSSRLFVSLRGRQSLTYGSYATLGGMLDGYPGYLLASAIFPHDVFSKGRRALRDEVALWAEKGVTAPELARRKEEIVGKYKVGLASTRGVGGALFSTIKMGRDIAYIDEYPRIIQALTLRDVNNAIKEHVHYDLAVTASAGAIDEEGKPLS